MTPCSKRFLCLVIAACVPFGAAVAAAAEPAWPGLRGPRYDGSADVEWPREPELRVRWKRALGSGYSGIAVAGDRGFTAHAEGGTDWLTAFDLVSGEELWRLALGTTHVGLDGAHDGPIATPAVGGSAVVAVHPSGSLVGATVDGVERWRVELSELGERPHYGFATSPLVVSGLAIVEAATTEGPSVLAFDAATGERRWAAGDDEVAYQSPVLAELGGRLQVVAVGQERLVGLDPATGAELWRWEHGGDGTIMGAGSAVPLALDGGWVLFDPKSDEVALVAVGAEGEVAPVWTSKALGLSYVPAVADAERVYGYSRSFLSAVDRATGEQIWKSRPPGDGFLLRAGDRLLVLTKKGSLHLAPLSATGFEEDAGLQLFDEHAWTAPIVVGDRIYARSLGSLAAVEVVQATGSGEEAAALGADLPDTAFGRFVRSLADVEDREAAVGAWLADVESFPLVEGRWVHFLWHGDAEDVGIVSDVIGDRAQEPMTRVPGTRLFYRADHLAPNAGISYALVPDLGDPVTDPRNPVTTHLPWGDPVSWVTLGPVSESADGPLAGRVERLELPEIVPAEAAADPSAESGEETEEAEETEPPVVEVYLPPGHEAGAEPLPTVWLFVPGRVREAGWLGAVDRAIAAEALPPVAVGLVHLPRPLLAAGQGEALRERFVADVLPGLEERFGLRRDRRGRCAVGQSWGGSQVALGLALDHPESFGAVAVQSPGMLDSPRREMEEAIAELELPLDVYLEWGHYDDRAEHEGWDIREQGRLLATALRAHGLLPEVHEVPTGHAWAAWTARAENVIRFCAGAAR